MCRLSMTTTKPQSAVPNPTDAFLYAGCTTAPAKPAVGRPPVQDAQDRRRASGMSSLLCLASGIPSKSHYASADYRVLLTAQGMVVSTGGVTRDLLKEWHCDTMSISSARGPTSRYHTENSWSVRGVSASTDLLCAAISHGVQQW